MGLMGLMGQLGQQVGSDVVAGEESVAQVYLAVHATRHSCEKLVARQVAQLVYPGVDRRSAMIVHTSLIAEDAGWAG